jgi:signal transduction histidine kinase/HAMP domain-containing protein/ActR/RegA family two-component response regulator
MADAQPDRPPAASRRESRDRAVEERLRSLRDALRAARAGDFSVRLATREADDDESDGKAVLLNEVALAYDALIEENDSLVAELERVSRVVGSQGRVTERVTLGPVSGAWATATDSINGLIAKMAFPVADATRVLTRVADGDLFVEVHQHIDGTPLQGEFRGLATAVTNVVRGLRSVSSGVIQVVQEIGVEGKLGARANIEGLSGRWKDLVDNVNQLSGNLGAQVRDIAVVSAAIAQGDLSQRITMDTRGEILQLKNAVNATVDQLRLFASEVIRVARDVGTEGKLGAQADVRDVSGVWQELTDGVNHLAGNLTSQVRNIAQVATAIADGDLSQKITVQARGEVLALKSTINSMVDRLQTFAAEVTRVAREVGTEGKLSGQANVEGVSGTWKDLTDNVNLMASNLTDQVRGIARVVTAVANGDLSQKLVLDAQGEVATLAETINGMIDALRIFAEEVTRVAREVGTEGKLGGQAQVPQVAGTWRELTESVNLMATNLTSQVRGIAKVVTAVAHGDLAQKLALEAGGEIAALAHTINDMTQTLQVFAEQVTTVAREVGVEGTLGGQARVPGAAGTWRDLVDNVNQLAGNLTTQVRAIAEVATAVTKGDLTRTISVEAMGEVLSLKDTINQMIANLRDTTRANEQQDWLKTNLAKFYNMWQGQRSLESLARLVISELTPLVSAQLGTFFVVDDKDDAERPILGLIASYGYTRRKTVSNRFALGEGLVGQAALEKQTILVTRVPEDYVPISSSLGEAPPRNLVVVPILFEDSVRGVIELGSFEPFDPVHITFLEQLMLSLGVVVNIISASRRTDELLDELKRSNTELESRSAELEEKASLLELRNREIGKASSELEEKAQQLALVSKYKSEFLANMSHEVRTPLNSIMVLANLMAENRDHTLSDEQVEFAQTIESSGRDLLALIDRILDLSKVEAGKLDTQREQVRLDYIAARAERHFRPLAERKNLQFSVSIDPKLPEAISTDAQQLHQILGNLISNAVKFTERGSVEIRMELMADTHRLETPALAQAPAAIAFAVSDTGVGISPEKQRLIFEAFQQADASTSRSYGGTGLGLTISRELARLLDGELHLKSTPGAGSTFTLYLPLSAEAVSSTKPPQTEPAQADVPTMFTNAPPARPRDLARPRDRETTDPVEDTRLAGKTILVVDDDARNLFAIGSLLERYQVEVLPVTSASAAMKALEDNPSIDLVLMDMMMPEIDGYEATRRLRRSARHGDLPVIALSAKALPADRQRALDAGCNDFVSKPVDRAQLIEVLERRLTNGASPT